MEKHLCGYLQLTALEELPGPMSVICYLILILFYFIGFVYLTYLYISGESLSSSLRL